jgi:hypothetical protein
MVAGVAFLWPPAGGDGGAGRLDEGWQRLPMGDTTAPASGSIRDAIDRCTALATRSRELTAGLFSADAGAPTGQGVADQVTTRRLARAACALAELEAQSTAPGARSDATAAEWAAKLAAADAAWRSLPVATAAP